MSTIAKCVRNGQLELYDVPSWEHRTPIREAYVDPALWQWVDAQDEPFFTPQARLGRRSSYEHLLIMLNDFRCAERPPGAAELKRMLPTGRGVWKLHPPSLRIFGWVPEADRFVAVCARTEAELKHDSALYQEALDTVVRRRKSMGLDSDYINGDYRAIFTRNA
jgi:hypothetical protein